MGIVTEETVIKGTHEDGSATIQHVFVDHLSREHRTLTRRVALGFDVNADRLRRRDRLDNELISLEADSYKEDVNDSIEPEYQTKIQAQKAALLLILKQDNLCDVLPMLKSVAFIKSKTDNQIKTVLGINDTQLAKLRAWQSDMEVVHEIDKVYGAVI